MENELLNPKIPCGLSQLIEEEHERHAPKGLSDPFHPEVPKDITGAKDA